MSKIHLYILYSPDDPMQGPLEDPMPSEGLVGEDVFWLLGIIPTGRSDASIGLFKEDLMYTEQFTLNRLCNLSRPIPFKVKKMIIQSDTS